MPLVEFERAITRESLTEGEDDGIGAEVRQSIAINPLMVSAVVPSMQRPDVTIIRGPDGRGLMVKGDFRATMAALGHVITRSQEEAEGEVVHGESRQH